MNIILVGITGVGKTTVGRLLAARLKRDFVDLDKSIELNCGVDIQHIFAIEGEVGFRARETKELRRFIDGCENAVLSVGGGCVMQDENKELILNNKLCVIQLVAQVDVLISRLSKNIAKRPLFNDINIKEKISQLKNERDNVYNLLSHLKVDTTRMKPPQVVDYICQYLDKYYRIK